MSRLSFLFSYAGTPDDLAACFETIRQLRPHLKDADNWCKQALAMRPHGYCVLACREDGHVVALAGYRLQTNLVHGLFLFVNDLVTIDSHRGCGLGARLLDELSTIAGDCGCKKLVLDTAMTNHDARRFYRREGLQEVIAGFVKPIGTAA